MHPSRSLDANENRDLGDFSFLFFFFFSFSFFLFSILFLFSPPTPLPKVSRSIASQKMTQGSFTLHIPSRYAIVEVEMRKAYRCNMTDSTGLTLLAEGF